MHGHIVHLFWYFGCFSHNISGPACIQMLTKPTWSVRKSFPGMHLVADNGRPLWSQSGAVMIVHIIIISRNNYYGMHNYTYVWFPVHRTTHKAFVVAVATLTGRTCSYSKNVGYE